MRLKVIFSAFFLFSLLLPPDNVFAVKFNYVGGTAKLRGYINNADDGWEKHLIDNVTVNVKVQWENSDSMGQVVAQTQINLIYADYTTIRDAMILDESREGDSNGLVRWLPNKEQFKADRNLYNPDNPIIFITQANWKALGFKGPDFFNGGKDKYGNQWNSSVDATITFNYDYFNGEGSNERDFNTIASHELGHILGFYSILDEKNLTAGPTALDMFRFESNSLDDDAVDNDIPVNREDFRTNERNLNGNGVLVYLVVDYDTGTTTFIKYMMSNTNHGRQGSHWHDFPDSYEIGVMDPGSKEKIEIAETQADFYALDLIGWEVNIFDSSNNGAKLGWDEYYLPPMYLDTQEIVSIHTLKGVATIINNCGDLGRVPPEYRVAADLLNNGTTVPGSIHLSDEEIARIEDAIRKHNTEHKDVPPLRIDFGRRVDVGRFIGAAKLIDKLTVPDPSVPAERQRLHLEQ